MKAYRVGILYCRCSNLMRQGKQVRLYRYTPERKKCPNCGKNRTIKVLKPLNKESKTLITESK